VPFCAAATMATAVVLARRSAPERVWSAASRHRPPSAVLHALQLGQAASVFAPVAAPGTTLPGVWTSLRWYLPSVPTRAVDARLTNSLSLLTGAALMVAAVAGVASHHHSFRWVWMAIGIAGLFIVVVSLIQRSRIRREAK
jgi:hypothetical protein